MKILDIEQGTDEWKEARLEMITGTRLGDVLGTKARQETLLNTLIAEHVTGQAKEGYKSPQMERGSEGEEYAILEYEKKSGEITSVVGMCVSEKYPYLAVSPDRLIKRKGKFVKGVEVKCPDTSTVIKYLRDGETPYEYLGQVLAYFIVVEDLKELDFVIYDPRIKKEQYKLNIKTVTREELQEEIEEAEYKLENFRELWLKELTNFNLNF